MQVQSSSVTRDNRDILIHIVDPDAVEGQTLGLVLNLEGYRTAVFPTGRRFYEAFAAGRADLVIISDRIGQDDSSTILRMLHAFWPDLPVVPILDQDSVGQAVGLLKAGAAGIMLRPIESRTTLEVTEEALAGRPVIRKLGPTVGLMYQATIANLTPREREVLSLISDGRTNKEAARALAISPRTIEVHRSRILEKYGVRNVVQLMRILLLSASAEAPDA